MTNSIYLRTNQWWQPKAGNILTAVYLSVFLFDLSFFDSIKYIFPAVITIFGIGFFGHLLNDYADKEQDKKVGKLNMIDSLSNRQVIFIFLAALFLAISPWFVLPFDNFSISLLVIEFILLSLYALSPFRLKNRGLIGVIVDSLYAYAVPFLLAFYTFFLLNPKGKGISYEVIFTIVVFFFWQLFTGLFNIATHQMEDYVNDIKTKTDTWVTKTGKAKARKFAIVCFWVAMLTFYLIFLFYASVINSWLFISIPLLFLFVKLKNTFKNKSFKMYLKSPITNDLQKLNINYYLFLPYWILLITALNKKHFLILLLVHFLVFNFSSVNWFIQKFIVPTIRSYIKLLFFRFPAILLNYSIFYFRIFILKESKARARREYQVDFELGEEEKKRHNTLPNVVVANSNFNKYTETFVKQHIKYLESSGYYVHQLYGGYLPSVVAGKGNLLSDNPIIKSLYNFRSAVFDLPENYFVNEALKDYLINNNIKLVLAEFGTSGVEVFENCKELQIPLVVVFYGYDAYHIKFSPKSNAKFKGLFEYASKIICVSKDIQTTLLNLGAPEEKLTYLPCAIDLNKFPYSDHSNNSPVFLSVGRFAETKSPHLSILAFNEVLKEIPDARLRMIGKDGGGELFEACHILVKALKIEDKVDFLGILPPEKVYEEMKNARVFVQHSVTTPLNGDKEGTPVSIMEAMACGLPVVATRHAGIAELITSGENGILVEEYDYLSMAREMVRVCESDNLISLIGEKASDSIRSNELIANNVSILVEIVEKHML